MKIRKRNLAGTMLIFLLMVSALPILGTQSDAILVGSSGAELTGIIDNDQGFDTDGDSLFDFLRVGVQVNVTEPDTYTVGISGLKNATGSGYIYVYNQTSAHLDPGIMVVNVSLSGRAISFSHVNFSMVSQIHLYGGNQTYEYVYDVALSKEYSYLWFDLPGASLTGQISDKGIDTDGDSLFNVLEIGVEVNVTDAGKYMVSISSLLDSDFYPNYIYVYNSTNLYLNSGIQNVALQLSGTHIRMSGFDPAYVSYIELKDDVCGVSETRQYVPLSKIYSHLDFDPQKAVLTGRIFDAGIDADDDGKFDYLQIGVEINVTDPGQYSLQVSGLKDSSLNKTIDVYDYESSYFSAGVQVSNLLMYGPSIYVSHSNPRYVSSISLYADYTSYEYDVSLSREYAYNEFDPPGAYLTGTIYDSGIDEDGDGKFNYLQVGVEVNITVSGSYYIYLSGLLDANSSLYFGRGAWQYLENGLQNVYFRLEGLRIRLAQFNAKYVDYVSMQDQGYRSLGSLNRVPLSREYQYTEFEHPPAELTGIIYDQGDDRDGDDLYDYLKIGVEVNVTEAGYYQVQANQLRDTFGNHIDVYGSTSSYLDVGTRVLNVSLNGLSIYVSERNPAYVSYIVLLDTNYIELDNLGKDVPLSKEYSYTEFDPPGAKLTGVIFDQGVDTDEDGTYDYLQIGVEVDVNDPGYYDLCISRLRDAGYNFIEVYSSNYLYLNAGLQVVYVNFEGPRIYVSHLNPRYIDYISLREQKTGFNDYLSGVPLSREYYYTEFDPPAAMLTGKIYDRGVDTDGDDAYNYLEIGVEINVTKLGKYEVSLSELRDTSGNSIWVWGQNSSYFDVGLGVLNVSLDGRRIYSSHRNPMYVSTLYLYSDIQSSLNNVALSHEYSYTEFDIPAFLTRVISDWGNDTDGDGKYDFLEVGVQVNVLDPGSYEIYLSGLLDSSLNYIDAWGYKYVYLDAGLHYVNFTVDGTRIFLSKLNPRYVNTVSLLMRDSMGNYPLYQDYTNQVPLSRQYSFNEFDPPGAMLTGKIYDQGVDSNTNGSFDFLEVGVELNVTENGTYLVSASGLLDAPPENESYWPYYISVGDSKTVDLDAGIRTVNLYLYGPQIHVSRHNPANVSYISVSGAETYGQSLNNAPLSRVYSYTEFDAPFWEVETEFVVYPDGRVVLGGSLEHTNMVPKNTGPTATGHLNLTGTDGGAQAQTGLRFTFPPELAEQFPFNSTTANMLASYSNGLLNFGMNSTLTLPPSYPGQYPYYSFGQWPFNTTDGAMSLTYSGGNLNFEINGNTTLPSIVRSQFPFNATDLTVVAQYANNMLGGTATFSVIDDFPFDDINVDFNANRTDVVLNGTVHVVFNVPFGSLIVHDQTELDELIYELEQDLIGEAGLVWNATGGMLNVTTFDATSVPNGFGATVTFRMIVHGDFVKGLAHLISAGRNPELLYTALDEAYSSAKSGSVFIDYDYNSLDAKVRLTFSYDLKRFIDNALTPPLGTQGYVVGSYSMYPTLAPGDLVFVEPVDNASDIVADSTEGDIIAFQNPNYYPYYGSVVIHRVIARNQTYGNGTWYFQTKGDINYEADPWWVPEHLVIGKVVRRVPLVGYLMFSNLFGYYYWYGSMPAPLWLGNAAFSSLQEASVKLSYSSEDRQFDLKLTLVDKLKGLVDEITQKLPQSWPPGTLPEVKGFYERLLNTTYASIGSAQFSFSYVQGAAELEGTVGIEGDLNKEINYVKDLYLQIARASYSQIPYNISIPWQFDFIDQTQLDLSELKVSAQLGETSFEGKVEGIVVTPQREMINATHFALERLFNLTAPQSPWQREFPAENQRLRITVEGGTNATHMVTLFRPYPAVPAPDSVGLYSKSMTWFNQTISSLKDLIFIIGPRLTGTLTVNTTPVAGEVFANGESWGTAPQSKVVDVGIYQVTFGEVTGYRKPAAQSATVYSGMTATVTGVYIMTNGTLTITTTPAWWGEVFVNGVSWGAAPQRRTVQTGTYTISFGAIDGFATPTSQVVTVNENAETRVIGTYEPESGTATAEIANPDDVNSQNPFILDAIEDASVHLTITKVSAPITIVVRNVTDADDAPPPGTWKLLGNCVQIIVNNTDVTVTATLRIYYTLSQLEAAGLDESTLKIHYWDATAEEWVAAESNVETSEHYVWTVIHHFSMWAVMGQPQAQPPAISWFIVAVVVAAVAVIAIVAVFARRRKTPVTSGKP